MNEEKDVKNEEVETSSDSSSEQNEQDSADSEVVKTEESDGKDYKAQYTNAVKALKEERERRKKLEAQTRTVAPERIKDDNQDQRFLRAEADAKIARLLQTDPTFKDRLEIVTEFVEEGYDIETADEKAKARIMDLIAAEAKKQEDTQQSRLTNLNQSAEPEEEERPSPNYKDLISGKFKDNPEAELIRKAMMQNLNNIGKR